MKNIPLLREYYEIFTGFEVWFQIKIKRMELYTSVNGKMV
jgi:hypothetical protein